MYAALWCFHIRVGLCSGVLYILSISTQQGSPPPPTLRLIHSTHGTSKPHVGHLALCYTVAGPILEMEHSSHM